MKLLTLPSARVPIGTATVQGASVDVTISMEWFLALAQLAQRTGGVAGIDISGVPALMSQSESAPVAAPAEAAAQAEDQAPTDAFLAADAEDLSDAPLLHLAAEVQRLRLQIHDLQQGTTP